jgi:baculoviral IAP repeat-containing protein 6
MPVSKRKSLSQPRSSSKKQRVDSSITIEEDEEEDLQLVLQQIKEQEASELLARRLQEEWDQNAQAGPSTSNSIDLESDEALARRLAAEWERQDAQSDVEFVESDTKEPEELDEHRHDIDTPDVQLAAFRDMFISSRPCTKCNKAVPAPRGYVCLDIIPPSPVNSFLDHLFRRRTAPYTDIPHARYVHL